MKLTKSQLKQIIREEILQEAKKRDYKAEYKKFQSSTKSKKYRAELNAYNRKKGTYGNGDGKDASHKGGKIAGFEKESVNRGRAEKSRLKKEGKLTEGFKKIAKKKVKYKTKMSGTVFSFDWEIESGIDTDVMGGNTPKIILFYQHEDETGFPSSGGNTFWLKHKNGKPFTPQEAKALVNKISNKKIHDFQRKSENPSGSGQHIYYVDGKFLREGKLTEGKLQQAQREWKFLERTLTPYKKKFIKKHLNYMKSKWKYFGPEDYSDYIDGELDVNVPPKEFEYNEKEDFQFKVGVGVKL